MPQSASAVADPYEGIATPIAAAPVPAPAAPAPAAPADTSDPYASIATPIPPPTDTGTKIEDQIHSAAQGVGAGAVALGKEAWGMVPTPEHLNQQVKSIWDASQNLNLPTEVLHVLPLVAAYENARSKGTDISGSLKAAAQHSDTYKQVTTAADSAEAAFKANPTKATAQALTVAIGNLAAMFGTGGESISGTGGATASEMAAEDAATASRMTAAAKPSMRNPFNAPQIKAESAVRGGIEAASPTGAAATAGQPLVSPMGTGTAFDKALTDLGSQAKTAYAQIDKTVGFDLKAEKTALDNDEYKLKQLGNTAADQTQRKMLQQSIADSTARIQKAESDLRAAKIDPAQADNLFKAQKAGVDLKNLVRSSVDTQNRINIDKLAKGARDLRLGKRGDRLAQFFGKGDAVAGKQAADQFMEGVLAAQKSGQTLQTWKNVGTFLAKTGLRAAEYGGVYEFMHGLFGH